MTFNFNDDLASVVSSEADATIGGELPNVEALDIDNEEESRVTAKDIVNWQEHWSTWSNYHRIRILPSSEFASLVTSASSHPIAQEILKVFSYAWSIPSERFTAEFIPPFLEQFLSEIVSLSPSLITTSPTPVPLGSAPAHILASHALQAHQLATLLVSQTGPTPDDTWEREIYRPFLLGCIGPYFEQLRDWQTPPPPIINPIPLTANTLLIQPRSIRPWGSIRTVAALSIFSQITSAQRDTSESDALYAFSIIACKAALGRIADHCGPVFGILLDREIVKIHADWAGEDSTHISLPLPLSPSSVNMTSPFLSLNLTSPSDTLCLAFILDAITTYAHITTPTPTTPQAGLSGTQTQTYIPSSTQTEPSNTLSSTEPREKAPGDEMSSKEKVIAWMMSGGAEGAVGG